MTERRTFKTTTGTYAEHELAVVVWLNPDHAKRPQARLLETLISHYSSNPMAFPIRSLQTTLPNPVIAYPETLAEQILRSSKEDPLIIPLPLARSELGWEDFYVPTTFTGAL